MRMLTARTSTDLKLLLAFVVLLQFGFPISQYGQVATALYMLGYAGMLVFGIRTAQVEEQHLPLNLALAAGVVSFGLWVALVPDSRWARLGMYVVVGLFLARLVVALFRFIFRPRGVAGQDLIVAAICLYLLLGALFVAMFGITESLQPGSLVDTALEAPVDWQEIIYYSYVTMATLGYGEILPISLWARSIAILQTVAGTMFIATVIARLVGLYASRSEQAETRPAGGATSSS